MIRMSPNAGIWAAAAVGLAAIGTLVLDPFGWRHHQQTTDGVVNDKLGFLKPGAQGLSIATDSHVPWVTNASMPAKGYTDYTELLTRIDSHSWSGPHTALKAGVDVQGDGIVTSGEIHQFVDSFDTDGKAGIGADERAALMQQVGRGNAVATGPNPGYIPAAT